VRWVAAIAVLFAAGWIAPAANASCVPRGARIVRANGKAQIFRSRGDRYYGCYRGRHVRVLLTTDMTDDEQVDSGVSYDSPSHIQLAGRYAAVAQPVCACKYSHGPGTDVVVADLRRRTTRQLSVGPDVSDFALNRHGDLAVIYSWAFTYGANPLDVWIAPWGGEVRELDYATDVERGSLALSATRVYWSRGGQPHVAAVRP
jgi:hypothetical protein